MRILVVHSFYSSKQPSGENAAVLDQVSALRRAGHEVMLAAEHTDDRELKALYSLRAALTVASGSGPSPNKIIRAFRPDVLHIHNLFPNFGRNWIRSTRVPIVHTLHNFRPLCAAAILFREGAVCTLCPGGDRWAGFRHACYRGSRARTLPLTLANRRGPDRDPVLRGAKRLVVLSPRAREIYKAAGVPGSKLVVIPNFSSDGHSHSASGESFRNDEWLYVGRLVREKGIDLLVERWPPDARLVVAGDGPLRREIEESAAGKRIRFVGHRSRSETLELMRACRGLLFPSRWYEGFPLVYAEALSVGLPVLAFEPSSVADFVAEDGTGVVASWRSDLGATLADAARRFDSLRQGCEEIHLTRYSEHAVVGRLSALYRAVSA